MSEENKPKPGTTRPPYDEAFKRAAVAQWMSGVPAKRVAEGLGITTESLRAWRRRQEGTAPATAGNAVKASTPVILQSADDLRAEVRRLRAALQSVTNQRDLLKKNRRDLRWPKRERFALIEAMEATYPTVDLCVALGVSRAGFYAWRARQPSARDEADAALGEEITAVFTRRRRTYGSPRVVGARRRAGRGCGRRRVARIMRGRGLAGRTRGRRRVATTDSDHTDPIAPNRLRLRPSPPSRPDEVWAADITYVATAEGWLYVAGVLDLYSRKLVGWSMGESLETALPMSALQMALRQRRPGPGLLHHSDRGSQYASEAYRGQLGAWGVLPSMSRRGNCYDNAAMESFWSTLKEELVSRQCFETHAQARAAIFDFIETFYNRERLHSALGFQSPVEFENQHHLN